MWPTVLCGWRDGVTPANGGVGYTPCACMSTHTRTHISTVQPTETAPRLSLSARMSSVRNPATSIVIKPVARLTAYNSRPVSLYRFGELANGRLDSSFGRSTTIRCRRRTSSCQPSLYLSTKQGRAEFNGEGG